MKKGTIFLVILWVTACFAGKVTKLLLVQRERKREAMKIK